MSANWNNPTTTSNYTTFVTEVKDRDTDLLVGMDPAVVTPTNVPTNALRWNSVGKLWEKFNGTSWIAMSADYAISITGSAAKWTTGRTITLTGAVSATSAAFDGSGNLSITTTQNTVAANAGGTGQTGYAVGDLLYANTTTTLAKLSDVATGSVLVSGGVGVAPAWGSVGLTTHVSGTLAVGNGGTGAGTFTSGGILRGNGTAAVSVASAADIVAAIGATAVANASAAADSAKLGAALPSAYVTRPVAGGRNGAMGIVRAGDIDGSADYSYVVRSTWDGTRWFLRGYGPNADTTLHAECRVGYADAAGTATSAGSATSAGNSNTVGGFTPSQTAGTASRVVVADASGYINNTYFNSSDNNQVSGVTAVMVKAGDNYFRSGTAAAIASFISGQTMNISGSATSAGTAGSATSAGTATNLAAGTAGAIPYQSAAGTTGFSAAGTAGQVLLSGGSGAPTWGQALGGRQLFTTSGSWTCPTGVTTIWLSGCGGGGGGGNTGVSNGGGGAGASILRNQFTVTPGNVYTVTIGAAGAVNTAGGASSFGALVTLNGGAAGPTSSGPFAASGGAGGGAGQCGKVLNGVANMGGAGGSSLFGHGGWPGNDGSTGNTASAGSAASGYGSGGAGAANAATAAVGTTGTAGMFFVEW